MINLIKSTMKKTAYALLVFSLLSALLLTPKALTHAAADYTVTDMTATGTVGSSALNVRSEPGKDYEAIGKVGSGETVTITGQTDNEWYRIDYAGKEGYVSSKYVTLGDGEESTVVANDPNDFTNYEEGSPQTDSILTTSPKMIILLGVIVIIVAIMVGTVIMIKKNDDEDYDDDYYEDDDYEDDDEEDHEDDEDDGEEEDEDDGEEDEEDDYYEEPVRRKKQGTPAKSVRRDAPRNQEPVRRPAPAPEVYAPQEPQRAVTEADYTLDIDPRIFDGEKPASALAEEPVEDEAPAVSDKEKDLAAAMSKLEELQQEIERLKNN